MNKKELQDRLIEIMTLICTDDEKEEELGIINQLKEHINDDIEYGGRIGTALDLIIFCDTKGYGSGNSMRLNNRVLLELEQAIRGVGGKTALEKEISDFFLQSERKAAGLYTQLEGEMTDFFVQLKREAADLFIRLDREFLNLGVQLKRKIAQREFLNFRDRYNIFVVDYLASIMLISYRFIEYKGSITSKLCNERVSYYGSFLEDYIVIFRKVHKNRFLSGSNELEELERRCLNFTEELNKKHSSAIEKLDMWYSSSKEEFDRKISSLKEELNGKNKLYAITTQFRTIFTSSYTFLSACVSSATSSTVPTNLTGTVVQFGIEEMQRFINSID
ncbi:hypothetical protein NOX90_00660 [Wolbachia endosymbiont of Anurida maritima]|uniref:hypothetical protein n=1 Tax=Wolbachia endosymbiont of Anurida maritima TaxID=2850562 RepID=UPI0035CF908E